VSRRATIIAIALAAMAGLLLRLRFLHVPINTDEGGYAAIARLWAPGFRLYGDVAWVDRPQALLVLFRITGAFGGDVPIRVLAMTAATLTAAAVAAAAWALAGRRAAVVAAVLVAVLSPAPHLEGFTANGEILAESISAVAVALAAWWLRRREPWLLGLAGLVAAIAPLVKQSAIDGALVLVVVVLVRSERRVRDLAVVVAGATLPVAATLVHAAITGLGDWWYAVLGYRSTTESAVSGDVGARLRLLRDSVPPALQDLTPLLVLLVPGLVAARRARIALIPAVWLAAGVAGFLGGGLYHPHYWVQLIAPLALVAAIGLDALAARPRVAVVLVTASLAVVIAFSAEVYTAPSAIAVSRLTSGDSRLETTPAVGRALAALTRPGERVYVIWANAAAYWYADRPPAFRYLWYLNVARIPGARDDVVARLTGPDPPVAVAVYQDPNDLDPTGSVARTLARRYTLVQRIGGIPVYRLRR
jgi:4-amino-4-deoxy-L-arabinose transferase-like glycosyltransferase